ncbi:hypothetical protein HYY70_03730 [Candidatus Woesearchaeota archaeon]|nr:hypothetical protein [Candidatus Woesearchaeota archaeon]
MAIFPKTHEIESIDELVALPDASNTFDLRKEDFQNFVARTAAFFEKYREFHIFERLAIGKWVIDAYGRHDGDGLWLPKNNWRPNQGSKLYLGVQNDLPEGETTYSPDRDFHFIFNDSNLRFVEGSPNLRVNHKPKFAFLANAEDKKPEFKEGPRGLYLSSGYQSPDSGNPWFYRREEIYIAR